MLFRSEPTEIKYYSHDFAPSIDSSVEVTVPVVELQPNDTYAANYDSNTFAFVAGCDTQFSYDETHSSTEVQYGLLGDNQDIKVVTYQGGGYREQGVVGAGVSAVYDIELSDRMVNGSITIESKTSLLNGDVMKFTVIPDDGYAIDRVYYMLEGDYNEYDFELDPSILYNVILPFEERMPNGNITLHADFTEVFEVAFDTLGGSEVGTIFSSIRSEERRVGKEC